MGTNVAFMVAIVACIWACSAGTGMKVPMVWPMHVMSERTAAVRSRAERLTGIGLVEKERCDDTGDARVGRAHGPAEIGNPSRSQTRVETRSRASLASSLSYEWKKL
ncbi:MAG: hypothetical protein K0R38_3398 [Polyangiaceae bacterium]|nr:hypothetical protein [Polyangiaceae bacterium]